MTDSAIWDEARSLAGNVASLWNGGAAILDWIEQSAEGRSAGPWEAVRRLGPAGVEGLPAETREAIHDAFQQLTRYLTAETWFDRIVAQDARFVGLKERPIAYFCAEFGLAAWLPIYSGGLGVLAGDVMKEASDLGLPFVGVGLFYRHGFFRQQLDNYGYQTELYPELDPEALPLVAVRDSSGEELRVTVPLANRTVAVRVWRLQVGRTPLYLLDTDLPENEAADRVITGGLYAGDQETRIQQEIVLGIGGVRVLQALGIEPSVYGMNEGHAAFLGVERLIDLLAESDFETALRRTRSSIVYTNHTVVPAGNDIFPLNLVWTYLGPYVKQSGLGMERLLSLAVSGPDEGVSMAVLAFHVAGKANAVSELHGTVVPREWPGFPIEVVTNGVHVPTWLGDDFRVLLDTYVPDWRSDRPTWERIDAVPDHALRAARARQRGALVDYLRRRSPDSALDPDALTLVWARRFAEYKRAWLLASDIGRLRPLLTDDERPVQIVIAGKAHPRDEGGKRVLQALLRELGEDPAIARRVVFLPDYDIRLAQFLVAGADIWVNTPRRPLEASGTSGMKASDNGALQLTVRDGWANEVEWWGVGWGIDGSGDAADAEQLYGYLENDIVPAFYDRDDSGISPRWTSMMRKSMRLSLERYSARRMLLDYVYKLYLPLLEEQRGATPVGT